MPKGRAHRARNESAASLARRLMRGQFALLGRAEAGLFGDRPQALHDFRVALRRLRVLLRLFRKPLAVSGSVRLEGRLRALSKSLGSARDAEIVVALLQRNGMRDAEAVLEQHRASLGRHRSGAVRRLRGAAYRRLKSDVRRLLSSEFPSAFAGSAVRTGARALKKALARVRERSRLSVKHAPRELHLLRIACRRARYAAEFFSPRLGRATARLGRRLKAVQDVLGDIHDGDICVAALRRGRPVPRRAIAELLRRRARAIPRFRKAWSRLSRGGF